MVTSWIQPSLLSESVSTFIHSVAMQTFALPVPWCCWMWGCCFCILFHFTVRLHASLIYWWAEQQRVVWLTFNVDSKTTMEQNNALVSLDSYYQHTNMFMWDVVADLPKGQGSLSFGQQVSTCQCAGVCVCECDWKSVSTGRGLAAGINLRWSREKCESKCVRNILTFTVLFLP